MSQHTTENVNARLQNDKGETNEDLRNQLRNQQGHALGAMLLEDVHNSVVAVFAGFMHRCAAQVVRQLHSTVTQHHHGEHLCTPKCRAAAVQFSAS